MLIRNIDKVEKKFKCSRYVMNYLFTDKNIPILGYDDRFYYFADTELLREVLEKAPTRIKIALWLEGNG